LLSVELSYIETRQETGVVPSGNSSGKSATAIITKETKLDAKKIQVQNREFTIDLDISRIPSPLVKRLVYWLGIGNAKDKPYKSMQVRETSQQNKRKKSFFEKKGRAIFRDILGRTMYKCLFLCHIYQGKLVRTVHKQPQKWLTLMDH
jgi:hypothetical protein